MIALQRGISVASTTMLREASEMARGVSRAFEHDVCRHVVVRDQTRSWDEKLPALVGGNYHGKLQVDPASVRGELGLESSWWWLRPHHVMSALEVSNALGATCEASAAQGPCTPQFGHVLRDVHLTGCITLTLGARSLVRRFVLRP